MPLNLASGGGMVISPWYIISTILSAGCVGVGVLILRLLDKNQFLVQSVIELSKDVNGVVVKNTDTIAALTLTIRDWHFEVAETNKLLSKLRCVAEFTEEDFKALSAVINKK